MIELVYVSRASSRYFSEQLVKLLSKARRNNTNINITGLLLYDGFGTFIQALEGAEQDVDALFAKIKLDPRHSRVNILWRKEIAQRGFPDWKMGFRDISETPPLELDGFSNFLQKEDQNDYLITHPGFALDMLTHFKSKHT